MKRYLGVDLHRTQFVVCTRWENGEQQIRQWRIGELARFVEQLQPQDPIDVIAGIEPVARGLVGNGGEPSPWNFDPSGSVEIAWRLAH